MKRLNELIEIIKSHKEEIKQRFGVKEIGLFGSYVREEQTSESDVDILIDFASGYKTFDNYMDLKFYLEELLNTKVDLVLKTAIKPRLKFHILKEIIYV